MTLAQLIQLIVLLLSVGFGSDVAEAAETLAKEGDERSSVFLQECQRGEASPYASFIKRLGRKLRTIDCPSLRKKLASSQHLYLGGRPFAAYRHRSRLRILAEFRQLTSLNINLTGTRDICPLAALTGLRRLIARNNSITDIRCLAGLRQLREINLGGNRLTEVTALTALPQLRQLKVNDNQVEVLDLRHAQPALRVVQVQRNGLRQILLPAQHRLNLTALNASGNVLGHRGGGALEGLSSLAALRQLDLSDNGIDDIGALAGLGKLEYLTLSYNGIRDLTPLKPLPALKRLWLAENPLGTTVAKTPANCPSEDTSTGLAAFCAAEY